MRIKFVGLIFLGFLFACSEQEDISKRNDDKDFYPLAIGNYWEYQVSESNYDAQGANERNFFLREVVEDSLVMADSSLGFIIRRFTKDSIDGLWFKESVYTVHQSDFNMTVNQDGVTLVKQIYPVSDALRWDPNVRNNLGEGSYEYSYQQKDTIINDSSYMNIVSVILDPPTENLTELRNSFEIYGKGVGLLVKDYTSLKYNTIQGDENEGEIASGIILKQYITAHGQQ